METKVPLRGGILPSCPVWLLGLTYLLYLGVVTRESLPLFAPIEWLHEGERLGTAQLLLNGGIPFRDIYLTHGLLSNVLRPMAAFWVFGESLAADRLFGLLVEPLSYVAAAFYLWKLFPIQSWRWVALLGFALYPLHLEPRHIVGFLSLGFLTAWAYERRQSLLVIGGVFAGLAPVLSTVDHAGFLLGAVLLFPAVLMLEATLFRSPVTAVFKNAGLPLLGGLLLGLMPFLSYLVLTQTGGTFVNDTLQRVLFDTVVRRDPYPVLSFRNAMWYGIPAFYAIVAVSILGRLRFSGDTQWTPIYPTLLFGIVSLTYGMRGCCEVYGKLAIVSFPFIVGLCYVLYRLEQESQNHGRAARVVLALSVVWTGGILFHALIRDWTGKQFIPQVLFPILAGLLLIVTLQTLARWPRGGGWRWMTVACPLAAVILGAWFYHDAKPHLLTAQLKKPRLMKDVAALLPAFLRDGRLTRDDPRYLQDELLAYLEAASRRQERVVILATGAGVYYFLANTSPPNRFPEVYHAQTDRLAMEVVDGLDRTGAEVLVACTDHGQAITGWPMNPHLAQFLGSRYADTGRRVQSVLLGADCPFEVWAPRHFALQASEVTG
jgi:hypothetical protein